MMMQYEPYKENITFHLNQQIWLTTEIINNFK